MHGGTSAAAPLVAGVVALALSVRPDLTWRDMQHIAVHSAQMVNPDDKDWQTTQAGRHYNHKYGYGLIDAYAFVEEAKRHKLVKPQAWFNSGNISLPIEETLLTASGIKSVFSVTQKMLNDANVATLEHVTARVWIHHDRRGDVDVELTSPHGTKSVLARPRRYDDAKTGFPGWSFMSLKHWDETPIGDWTIKVTSTSKSELLTGNFIAWSLTLWGESIDPSKAKLWNFPENSLEFHETLAAAPTGTQTPSTSTHHSKPTAHLPGDHGTAPGESHEDFTNGNTAGSKPEADTGYIAGLKKNSTWLFIAAGVVLIFASSVGAFFILRRRRNKARGGDYEFVPEDEDLAMSHLERGRSGAGGKRAKELYDAFAEGGSDEEDEGAPLAPRSVDAYRDVPDDAEPQDDRFAIDDESDRTPITAERYRDRDDAEEEEEAEGKGKGKMVEKEADLIGDAPKDENSSGSGSGSWQDAAH